MPINNISEKKGNFYERLADSKERDKAMIGRVLGDYALILTDIDEERKLVLVNNDYENTNFLNLPKGFKLGG